MSISQLILGTALGFLVAQGALLGIRRFFFGRQRDAARQQISKATPSSKTSLIGAFVRYAGLVGVSAGVITLGVWAIRDYLVAKSGDNAAIANVYDPGLAQADPHSSAEGTVEFASASRPDPSTAAAPENAEPYADAEFQVQRRHHHAGALSLKETLLLRSEEKARADLLSETQQHTHRSQYDCEAADRAIRYVDAGLDVWGFASWQRKYFPVDNYDGATLTRCKDIENRVAPLALDVKSTVAHQRPQAKPSLR